MPDDFHEITLRITTQQTDQRLDKYLAHQIGNLSRSRIKALLDEGLITLDDKPVKASHLVKHGEIVLIRLPGPKPSPLLPEDIPLEVHYEDDHLIVINKPAGMVVHPAYGHSSGTLVNGLLHHCRNLPGIGGELRPGLVHRLDKDTSGLLVVAKSERALEGLAKQFKKKTTERLYRCLAWGSPQPPEGRIDEPLGRSKSNRKLFDVIEGGKEAATRYRTLDRFDFLSLLEMQLETGRTHQIRIHLHHIGHPVFGDPQYGGRNRRLGALSSGQRKMAAELFEMLPRQALHAATLGFIHPKSGEKLSFSCDFPEDIQKVLEKVRG
jgi:23S rRNA pseudouridine1911/1915/1917 synthase